MKWKLVIFLVVICCCVSLATAQSAQQSSDAKSVESSKDQDAKAYSGMYTFLREGEFVQITVEDGGSVTGFISRFGDGESDKGAFLDQFFKTGKLAGKTLTFRTDVVHGLSYDFKGEVDRGEGKSAGDDAYFVLKGALTENVTDVNKKVSSHSRDVVLKMFPQDATPGPPARK
jgi:hypothetical protein